MRVLVAVVAGVLFVSACSSSSKSDASSKTDQPSKSAVSWPAPNDPMKLARDAGLVPETAERLQYHVHAHLDVFVDGASVVVPAGIGIDITNPGVHTFGSGAEKEYGGIDPPCDVPCISPLHTHDISGTLHTESATRKNNTLGQFFTEWGVKLDEKCVSTYCKPGTTLAFYIDGEKASGDPRKIALTNLREIAVVIGTPPAKIPDSWDPSA